MGIKTMYITFIADSNASKENKAIKLEHSKPEKFEQVENALEAMFGIEEKSGTPCCARQSLFFFCLSFNFPTSTFNFQICLNVMRR